VLDHSEAYLDQAVESDDDFAGILVFPDPYDLPSDFLQPSVRVSIASLIGFDLVTPKGNVTLRRGSMLGASMPEATVHENGNLSPCEGDIGSSSRLIR
jgi:hypothetical protein